MAQLTLGSGARRVSGGPTGQQHQRPREHHAVNPRADRWSDLTQQFAEALSKLPKTTSVEKGGAA